MKNCMKEMNPKKEAHRKKVIIDTDIGDDADDALAICLALKSPELELLGVTTVFRNTAARAKIAVQLLKLMGREGYPRICRNGASFSSRGGRGSGSNPASCRYGDIGIPEGYGWGGVSQAEPGAFRG